MSDYVARESVGDCSSKPINVFPGRDSPPACRRTDVYASGYDPAKAVGWELRAEAGKQSVDLSEYQRRAGETNHLPKGGPREALQPMLGLGWEIGSILNVYMRYLRDNIDLDDNTEQLREELGDVLWYTAAIATACQFDLGQIAEGNLERTRDRYLIPSQPFDLSTLPVYDLDHDIAERFPRRMVFEFVESRARPGGHVVAQIKLINAQPNAFPDGPVTAGDAKPRGYQVGALLGNNLNDNSRLADGYRYHDAIHFGFMAVLGWSPNSRALLGIKRKSDEAIDRVEDGARAIFAEEGIAAALSKLAKNRTRFLHPMSVDGEVVEVVRAISSDLEVENAPAWLWRSAISQGFQALKNLTDHRGGYLIADLDQRTLTYQKML